MYGEKNLQIRLYMCVTIVVNSIWDLFIYLFLILLWHKNVGFVKTLFIKGQERYFNVNIDRVSSLWRQYNSKIQIYLRGCTANQFFKYIYNSLLIFLH